MGFNVHITVKKHGETKKVFARQFPGTLNGASKANKYASVIVNNDNITESTVSVTRRVLKKSA